MLNTISKFSDSSASYAAQSLSAPKLPSALKKESDRPAALDTYERADGSTATRNDAVQKSNETSSAATQKISEPALSDDEKKFKELLHQFVGQVLFGQMLKSMREKSLFQRRQGRRDFSGTTRPSADGQNDQGHVENTQRSHVQTDASTEGELSRGIFATLIKVGSKCPRRFRFAEWFAPPSRDHALPKQALSRRKVRAASRRWPRPCCGQDSPSVRRPAKAKG